MCHLLDITPRPNNGSLENVKAMLKEPDASSSEKLAIKGTFLLLFNLIMFNLVH